MNATTITALITALTALIGAISGLVILVVHIIRHQAIPGDNPAPPPVKPSIITPTKYDKPAA